MQNIQSVHKNKIKTIIELWLTFMKIGGFTFGGGYAMIPLIEKEIVENKKWITKDDILDIIAIAESTPGPIAINAATFVGYKVCGFWGAFFATIGVVLPSFLIILVISFILSQFENNKYVVYAFNGVRAGVLALIIKAFISMYRQCPKHLVSYIIAIFAFTATALFNINVLLVIVICAITGLIWSLIASKKGSDQK